MLAGSIYDTANSSSNRLTGLLACCNETATTAFAGLAESTNGQWEGKLTSTTEAISLAVLRTMATTAKLRDGNGGKPNLLVMTETLYNVVADLLQIQQRFTDSKATVDAGFTGLAFEGKDIFPDDYCPSGYAFALNTMHIGFAVHKDGYFVRSPWKVIPGSPEDKTMKIYADMNMIVNDRRAQIGHSNLS